MYYESVHILTYLPIYSTGRPIGESYRKRYNTVNVEAWIHNHLAVPCPWGEEGGAGNLPFAGRAEPIVWPRDPL